MEKDKKSDKDYVTKDDLLKWILIGLMIIGFVFVIYQASKTNDQPYASPNSGCSGGNANNC